MNSTDCIGNSLIIIVDLWQNEKLNNLAQNIKEYIENTEHIKSVCLSSYFNVTNICSSDHYWKNSKKLFNDIIEIDAIRKNWIERTKEKNITHSTIMSIKPRNDQFFFSASSPFEIIYYCNSTNQSIRNIYWAGVDWRICIRDRPVGYQEIINCYKNNFFKNKINFRTNKTLIATNKELDSADLNFIDCEPCNNWIETDVPNEWIYKIK